MKPSIRPEHRELVFQTGFTTKSSGTGMGLAIARRIKLESGGAGTVFIGMLPKQNAADEKILPDSALKSVPEGVEKDMPDERL